MLNVNAAQPISGLTIANATVNDGAANSLGSGPVSLTGGTLNVSNAQSISFVSFNSGLLNIAGSNASLGTAGSPSAAARWPIPSASPATLSGNNPQTWNGDFTFNGTQGLSMGTGAVMLCFSRTVTVNAGALTVGGAISGSGCSLTLAGAGNLTLNGIESYTGNTIVNGGTLQLNNGSNGGGGQLGASPAVVVDAGGFLALNANADVLGYTSGRDALTINDGVVSTLSGIRATIQNQITMTGGTLSGVCAGNTGNYSFNNPNGFAATSDANGNPAVVNAAALGLQNGYSLLLNVTGGTATPPADIIITSNISTSAAGRGLTQTGNGILWLTGASTYTGAATALSGGTLQLGTGAGRTGRAQWHQWYQQ